MPKIQWKGGTLLGPVPAVLVSCGNGEESNVLTVAWTGILNSDPPKTYISVRPERYSHHLIRESGEFVLNLTTSDLVYATDFCGIKSGKNTDKAKETGLHYEPSSVVGCPSLRESPLALECKVTDIVPLGSHDMFVADIKAVCVDETLVDENGKLHLDRAHLLAYSHGEYFALGKKLGKFGYSCSKTEKKRRRKKKNDSKK